MGPYAYLGPARSHPDAQGPWCPRVTSQRSHLAGRTIHRHGGRLSQPSPGSRLALYTAYESVTKPAAVAWSHVTQTTTLDDCSREHLDSR